MNALMCQFQPHYYTIQEKTNLSNMQQKHYTAQIIHGIRLWFLPGLEEIPIELIPEPNEVRFGMEINRTEEVDN